MKTNVYYQIAFAADFSTVATDKELCKAFEREIDNLVGTAKKKLYQMMSITSVVEVFHYASLAAAFIQRKAELRAMELLKNAPPEENVLATALAQLGFDLSADSTDYDEVNDAFIGLQSIDVYADKPKLAKLMAQSFEYTGKAMRAFTMVCVLSTFNSKGNLLFSPGKILKDYAPTNFLTRSKSYPVIGTVAENLNNHYSTISVHSTDFNYLSVKGDTSCGFSRVFTEKLSELFAWDGMSFLDWARLEEMRDFMLDTLCRAFFELRAPNLPRVFNLITALTADCDDTGCISEEKLREVMPNECAELLARESIVTKAHVGTNGVFYRANAGIKGFVELVEHYSLIVEHKFAPMQQAANAIK